MSIFSALGYWLTFLARTLAAQERMVVSLNDVVLPDADELLTSVGVVFSADFFC